MEFIVRGAHEFNEPGVFMTFEETGKELSDNVASLGLAFDRERMWYELLRAGYTLQDLRTVVGYLQREILAQRRNVGALKLSNLLQLDRFEEDLQISRVRLRPPSPAPTRQPTAPTLNPAQLEQRRQQALIALRQFKATLA